jgi:hypothetical protein
VAAKPVPDRERFVKQRRRRDAPGRELAADLGQGERVSLRPVVKAIDGPVLLVGHSYGGAVITQASAGLDNVTGLVYLAAFGLDAGESCASVQDPFPPSMLASTSGPTPYDAPGAPQGPDLYIAKEQFRETFCADVPVDLADVMFATQRPPSLAALTENATAAGWKTKPSWFLVSEHDSARPTRLVIRALSGSRACCGAVPAAGPESKASLRQARRKGVLVAYDEELAGRVRAVLPRGEAVTEREMFGGLAFMLGGHMFCGIVKDALMARLGPEAADRALDQPHVRPMDFTGRPMKGMVFIDPAGLQGDALRQWVDAAAGYARGLPP